MSCFIHGLWIRTIILPYFIPGQAEILKYYGLETLKGKGCRVTFNATGWHKLTGFCHV